MSRRTKRKGHLSKGFSTSSSSSSSTTTLSESSSNLSDNDNERKSVTACSKRSRVCRTTTTTTTTTVNRAKSSSGSVTVVEQLSLSLLCHFETRSVSTALCSLLLFCAIAVNHMLTLVAVGLAINPLSTTTTTTAGATAATTIAIATTNIPNQHSTLPSTVLANSFVAVTSNLPKIFNNNTNNRNGGVKFEGVATYRTVDIDTTASTGPDSYSNDPSSSASSSSLSFRRRYSIIAPSSFIGDRHSPLSVPIQSIKHNFLISNLIPDQTYSGQQIQVPNYVSSLGKLPGRFRYSNTTTTITPRSPDGHSENDENRNSSSHFEPYFGVDSNSAIAGAVNTAVTANTVHVYLAPQLVKQPVGSGNQTESQSSSSSTSLVTTPKTSLSTKPNQTTAVTTTTTTNNKNLEDPINFDKIHIWNTLVNRMSELRVVDGLILLVGGSFSLLTILGNVLVMVAFKIDRNLQTISNYFLLSLAVADFLIGFISMPLSLIYIVARGWPLGPVACDLWLAIDYLNSNASVLNLLLISFDRYFSVTRPLTYRARRTTRRACSFIAFAWIISALLWPPWIFAWPSIEGRRTVPHYQCYIPFLESNIWVTLITAFMAFWLPVTIMCVLYWRIWRETEKRYRELTSMVVVSSHHSTAAGASSSSANQRRQQNAAQQQQQQEPKPKLTAHQKMIRRIHSSNCPRMAARKARMSVISGQEAGTSASAARALPIELSSAENVPQTVQPTCATFPCAKHHRYECVVCSNEKLPSITEPKIFSTHDYNDEINLEEMVSFNPAEAVAAAAAAANAANGRNSNTNGRTTGGSCSGTTTRKSVQQQQPAQQPPPPPPRKPARLLLIVRSMLWILSCGLYSGKSQKPIAEPACPACVYQKRLRRKKRRLARLQAKRRSRLTTAAATTTTNNNNSSVDEQQQQSTLAKTVADSAENDVTDDQQPQGTNDERGMVTVHQPLSQNRQESADSQNSANSIYTIVIQLQAQNGQNGPNETNATVKMVCNELNSNENANANASANSNYKTNDKKIAPIPMLVQQRDEEIPNSGQTRPKSAQIRRMTAASCAASEQSCLDEENDVEDNDDDDDEEDVDDDEDDDEPEENELMLGSDDDDDEDDLNDLEDFTDDEDECRLDSGNRRFCSDDANDPTNNENGDEDSSDDSDSDLNNYDDDDDDDEQSIQLKTCCRRKRRSKSSGTAAVVERNQQPPQSTSSTSSRQGRSTTTTTNNNNNNNNNNGNGNHASRSQAQPAPQLRRHQASVSQDSSAQPARAGPSTSTASTVPMSEQMSMTRVRATIQPKSERKAAKTLSAILLAFIVTWTPYNVLGLLSLNKLRTRGISFGEAKNGVFVKTISPQSVDSDGVWWQFAYYLCYINSTLNPLCYALCNANFRRTYTRILTCKFRRRNGGASGVHHGGGNRRGLTTAAITCKQKQLQQFR